MTTKWYCPNNLYRGQATEVKQSNDSVVRIGRLGLRLDSDSAGSAGFCSVRTNVTSRTLALGMDTVIVFGSSWNTTSIGEKST